MGFEPTFSTYRYEYPRYKLGSIHQYFLSEWRVMIPLPLVYQTSALPIELHSVFFIKLFPFSYSIITNTIFSTCSYKSHFYQHTRRESNPQPILRFLRNGLEPSGHAKGRVIAGWDDNERVYFNFYEID